MIKVKIFRNKNNEIYGFKAFDHGDSIVCASVSTLTINCVNSIEAFCDADFSCDAKEDGYLEFLIPSLKNGNKNEKCSLLLDSMMLGLISVETEHPNEIEIID